MSSHPASPKKAASITHRILKEAVLIVVLFAGLLLVAFVFGLSGFQRGQQEKIREDLTVLMGNSLTAAVWHYDVRSIDDIITSFQNTTDLQYAVIRDQYGSILSDKPLEKQNRPADASLQIPAEFGGIAGEMQIWWGPSKGNFLFENRFIVLGLLGILLVVGTATSFLIYHALHKYIVYPLEELRSYLLDPTEDERITLSKTLENTREFILFKNAFDLMNGRLAKERRLRDYAMEEKNKTLIKNERVGNALSTVFSSVHQTIVIVDKSAEMIASRISSPFGERHISQILAVARNTVAAQDAFKEMGGSNFRFVDHVSGKVALEFMMPGGRLISCLRVEKDGNQALILTDITSQSTTESALDEILQHSQTGIAIFSKDFQFEYERGASLERLKVETLPLKEINLSGNKNSNCEIRRCLREPGREATVSLDQRDYILRSVKLRSGLICLVHSDVTHVRKIEREMQQGRNLRVLGQLTSGIAHDFNNILGVVIGNLELMQGLEDAEARQRVDEALHAATRGVSTIKHLLAYSRNQPLAPEPTDFDRTLIESLGLFKNAAGPNIEVLLEARSNATILVDQTMLVSALMNMVVNARDAMQGKGRITLRTSIQEGETDGVQYVVLRMQDTGPGVPEHLKAGIFDPFVTTKPPGTGTGLGLAMVKGFVEKSEGMVSYQNLPDGAEFSLFFKARNANAKPAIRKLVKHANFPKVPQKEKKAKVMLLDDEEALLRSTELILKKLNYEVFAFCNPMEAEEWLSQEQHPDILMTDYAMPEMDGLQFIRRNLGALSGVSLVLCSGNVDDGVVAEAQELGEIRIFQKPFLAANIAQEFDTLTRNKALESASAVEAH